MSERIGWREAVDDNIAGLCIGIITTFLQSEAQKHGIPVLSVSPEINVIGATAGKSVVRTVKYGVAFLKSKLQNKS